MEKEIEDLKIKISAFDDLLIALMNMIGEIYDDDELISKLDKDWIYYLRKKHELVKKMKKKENRQW